MRGYLNIPSKTASSAIRQTRGAYTPADVSDVGWCRSLIIGYMLRITCSKRVESLKVIYIIAEVIVSG